MLTQELNRQRFDEAGSAWLRSFSLASVKCLIVCRGPVRKEAIDVFDEVGVREYGILLSEKDSIVYPRCLAPELRDFRFPANVHRVPDYMGAGQEEKIERIAQIIGIAREHGYTHIFAGYGFMAEDADFIEAIERAGITFVGPASRIARAAGAKDEAKKLARRLGISVTPGIDSVSALALLARVKDKSGLQTLARSHQLAFEYDAKLSLEDNAEALLQLAYARSLELVTIEELQATALEHSREIWKKQPGSRVRFKYIGGGGGKGQRTVAKPDEVAKAVMEVLAESKVVAPGSNRNFLIELNVESTRHNEIQLIGNGQWCLSLGGRDCSVQMHEQKLVEVSLTSELLEAEITAAKDNPTKLRTLRSDKEVLARMESEAEAFGSGVKLDSVSTFESIVSGDRNYFMEVNTRIQVEHRVTELAYRLKFTNPENKQESFYVESLIEAMLLLAVHGPRVPKPQREVRNVSGAEVRINATNAALQPHAGGLIRGWSAPLPDEIRDDQGIGRRNPDTGSFIYYNLAGAYDSNIALVVAKGSSRRDNLARLAEMLRCTELRGDDLQTNMPVLYGLLNWMLGKDAMVKPSTAFMKEYLAAVGALEICAREVDMELAWSQLLKRYGEPEANSVLRRKATLLVRPLQRLIGNPHLLAGFLGLHDGRLWKREGQGLSFGVNPVEFLAELYRYINLEDSAAKPPAEKIWDHDQKILSEGLEFYSALRARTQTSDFEKLSALLRSADEHVRLNDSPQTWQRCQAAHRGHQLGMELLLIIPRLGVSSGFFEGTVDDTLTPSFPERFRDAKSSGELIKALAPPPAASSDEIVTPTGGHFYSREAPHLPPLVQEGQHFEAGQPLFIIEVMKMFNKVLAPFAGTVRKTLMDADGKTVRKGQAIFKIEPDEVVVFESDAQKQARRRAMTLSLLG